MQGLRKNINIKTGGNNNGKRKLEKKTGIEFIYPVYREFPNYVCGIAHFQAISCFASQRFVLLK
jgi:hypothetical protein